MNEVDKIEKEFEEVIGTPEPSEIVKREMFFFDKYGHTCDAAKATSFVALALDKDGNRVCEIGWTI